MNRRRDIRFFVACHDGILKDKPRGAPRDAGSHQKTDDSTPIYIVNTPNGEFVNLLNAPSVVPALFTRLALLFDL